MKVDIPLNKETKPNRDTRQLNFHIHIICASDIIRKEYANMFQSRIMHVLIQEEAGCGTQWKRVYLMSIGYIAIAFLFPWQGLRHSYSSKNGWKWVSEAVIQHSMRPLTDFKGDNYSLYSYT